MEGRVKHSVNNVVFGIIEQVMTILLTFVTRTVFIRVLDDSLLGINGLFSNILSLLSIAELGFGTAIIYGMYKPIADNDKKKLAALMNYYRKIYNIIAISIAVIGIALIPFLKYLVNFDGQIDHIVLYYLIFLGDSVCSYLLANRIAIIEANQNYYVIKRYNTCFIILKNILQIISLLIFKNFVIYLLILVFTTFSSNLYGAILAKKMYPYAFEKEQLEEKEKKSLIENVKSMFLYKIGFVLMEHTDNILISILAGTIKVGYYSNYNMIVYSITRFTNIIFNSVKASVGNLNAGNDNEKKIRIFDNLSFLTDWVYGFVAVALFMLLNDFITLWIGDKFIFTTITVFSIVLDFYIKGTLNTITVYRETTGIFNQTKYVYLFAAILNVILSIILGKIYGVFGVIISSSISKLLTNCWYEPYILFKQYFKYSAKKYFVNRIKNVILIGISIIILMFIFTYIKSLPIKGILIFVLQVGITAIIPNLLFLLVHFRKEEFKYYEQLALGFLKRKKEENA